MLDRAGRVRLKRCLQKSPTDKTGRLVHRCETLPVEIESGVVQDLDKLVSNCQERLFEMRLKYPNTPPDGFLVFDSDDNEVRRWFESARPKE